MRSNDFNHKRVAFVGYFASTSLKIKHFQELFESVISNLCILDKHLVCILCEFNFRNGHFPKHSRGFLRKALKFREIAKYYTHQNLSL